MIYLVAGDNGSQFQVVLYRSDGNPRDLTGWTVKLRVRRSGTNTVLFTVTGTGTTEEREVGLITFTLNAENLARDAGPYQGEVSTQQGALVLTDFPLVDLSIREDF